MPFTVSRELLDKLKLMKQLHCVMEMDFSSNLEPDLDVVEEWRVLAEELREEFLPFLTIIAKSGLIRVSVFDDKDGTYKEGYPTHVIDHDGNILIHSNYNLAAGNPNPTISPPEDDMRR